MRNLLDAMRNFLSNLQIQYDDHQILEAVLESSIGSNEEYDSDSMGSPL